MPALPVRNNEQSGSEEEEAQASVLGEEKPPSANGHWDALQGKGEGVGWVRSRGLAAHVNTELPCRPASVSHILCVCLTPEEGETTDVGSRGKEPHRPSLRTQGPTGLVWSC